LLCIILILHADWEGLWQEGRTRWDAGKPSPALVKLFDDEETRSLIPEHGQGLVPGCGSGNFICTEKLNKKTRGFNTNVYKIAKVMM
jgi:hypothetical protein